MCIKPMWNKFKKHLFFDIYKKINKLDKKNDEILDYLNAIKRNNLIMFFGLYKSNNEPLLEAKKRFFSSLETTDDFIALKQKGNYILLKNFIDLCNKNNLIYWITYGTLLGAVRHRGFIPWDDDIDIAMPIEELNKLKQILKNNMEFCIEYICEPSYSIFLPRFIFKNHSNLWMIDVYPRVPVKGDLNKAEKYYLKLQNELLIDLKKSKENILFDGLKYEREIPINIMNDFNAALNTKKTVFYNALNSISTNNNIVGYVYDVGHPINDGGQNNFVCYNDIYPLKQLQFLKLNVNVPNNYSKLLFSHYGDIYKLPNDVGTRLHGNCSNIDINSELDYLKKFSD